MWGTRASEPELRLVREISSEKLPHPIGFSKQWELSLEVLIAILDMLA